MALGLSQSKHHSYEYFHDRIQEYLETISFYLVHLLGS